MDDTILRADGPYGPCLCFFVCLVLCFFVREHTHTHTQEDMEESSILKGSIIQPYSVEQGVCRFLFQAKDGERYSLSDPERCMPAYSVALQYTIEISGDRQAVLSCLAAVRPVATFPLPYSKLRTALTKKASFGSKRLSAVFKGRNKGCYPNAAAMIEYIDDVAVRNTALRLFDRHFQPTEYYVVACYLNGPQLLEKSQEELQQLQTFVLTRPSLCCFLSCAATPALMAAVRGIHDMSLASLQRCCKGLKLKEELELANSPDFQASLAIYQRWQKEVALFGSTQHKLQEGESEADLDYLMEKSLVHRLPSGQQQQQYYCLLPAHRLGDGAVAHYIQTQLSSEQRQRRIITEFTYTPKEMPLLLVRHCGSNYYDALKQLIRSWRLDAAGEGSSSYRVYCPTLYHAQQFEANTGFTAAVYQGEEEEEEEQEVGLLVLDRLHLWDAKAVGPLLKPGRCVMACGDDREMPVHASQGSGALFSDLYRSGLLPLLRVEREPPGLSEALTELLLKGSRLRSSERVYTDIPRMSLDEFWATGKQLKMWIRSQEKSLRILVRKPEQRSELYSKLRELVWEEKEYNSNHFYCGEVVYCRRLSRSLQAYSLRTISRFRDCRGVCQVTYSLSSTDFPARLSPQQQVTDRLILRDSSTGECYESPLCYSDGLQPASVDLYSRCQTASHTDILFVVLDRDTPWRLLYSALLQASHHCCLLYDSHQEPDPDQLLQHIVEHNWKGYYRSGALFTLLQHASSPPEEEEEDEDEEVEVEMEEEEEEEEEEEHNGEEEPVQKKQKRQVSIDFD